MCTSSSNRDLEIQSLPPFLYALVESSQLQLQFSKSKHPCSVRGELKLGLYRDGGEKLSKPTKLYYCRHSK